VRASHIVDTYIKDDAQWLINLPGHLAKGVRNQLKELFDAAVSIFIFILFILCCVFFGGVQTKLCPFGHSLSDYQYVFLLSLIIAGHWWHDQER
jgi:hypothetical protein